MYLPRACNLSLALLIGIATGVLCGGPILGCSLGVFLTALMGAWLWRRAQRHTGQRQAHKLVVLRAVAERAIREGQVTTCWGCQRPVRRGARRCLYCGTQLVEGPLR
jgi:hypothetical protein